MKIYLGTETFSRTSIEQMKIRNQFYFFLLNLIFLIPFQGCGQANQDAAKIHADSLRLRDIQNWNQSIPGNFSSQTKITFDSLEISGFLIQYPNFNKFSESILAFYSHRNMAFAWFDKDGLIEHAANLTDRVMNLKYEGVNKEVPYVQSLDSLLYEINFGKFSTDSKVRLELMLTAQYFAFADIVWEGMDEGVLKEVDWHLPRKKVSYEEYLDSILATDPTHLKENKLLVNRQYGLLRDYLQKYRNLEEKGDWFEINTTKSIRPGDSSEIVGQIKQKLFDLGDLEQNNVDLVYDADLEMAVKKFQIRHGLKDDGVVGKGTLSEMNVPYKTRIEQIIVNMERSRWVPVSQNKDYLVVNIPEFKLHVNSGDKLLWSCNVVVGKDIHKTVVFSGELKYIVFRPYWNIPKSIVKNEVLKDMARNRNYLAQHNMEITGYREGLPEIRQKPGDSNSLGLVKFLFPNSYNIYLHDTPAKSLFNESDRAFSHGCIRVSEPFKLAQFLLRNNPVWDNEKIEAAMNTGGEKAITLSDKASVFIVYFTSFVDREGKINFRKDIYGRDGRLAEMMMQK